MEMQKHIQGKDQSASGRDAGNRDVKQPSPVDSGEAKDAERSKQVNPGDHGLNPGQRGPAQPSGDGK